MKVFVTLGVGVSLSLFVQGQVDLHPVISPTRMNVVYRGIPNPMAVAVPGHTWNDIRLEVDDVHRLECDDSGTCLLTPCNDVKVRSLEVRATVTNDEGQTTALSPVPFRIRRIPDPELKWVGHTAEDQFIWRASMLSFASVAVAMSNFDFDVDMQVVTFWLGVERGGEFRYFRSDNFFLTEEMKQALVLTQPGDRIWIGNAYVSMPDGTERELAPLLLTLKD